MPCANLAHHWLSALTGRGNAASRFLLWVALSISGCAKLVFSPCVLHYKSREESIAVPIYRWENGEGEVKGQVFKSRAISGGKKPTALMLDISGAFSTAKKPQGLSVLHATPAALQSAWPWHGIMESQNLTMAYVGKGLKDHLVQISLLQAALPA